MCNLNVLAPPRRGWPVRVSAAACALSIGLTQAAASAQTRFIDDAQRRVELPAKVVRVFAAGFPAEILLYTLVPDMLAGRNHPPAGEALEFFPPAYRAPVLIKLLPERNGPAHDAELLALKPDVYIDYGSVHEDYIASLEAVQRRTGIPALILDGSLARVPATYRRLGAALGEVARGERLALAAEVILTKYRGALASGGAPLRVYLACSPDGLVPCLSDESAGEQIALLGGINVAGTSVSAPMRPLTVDEIRALAPDVVVVNGGPVARLRADPQWQSVGAVARGRVHALPDLPYSWGSRPPSVNRLAGLIWLAYVLPGRAFDTAFDNDVRAFFREFYHVDLTDAQVQRLRAN